MLKYRRGRRLTMIGLCKEIEAGHYVYLGHPSELTPPKLLHNGWSRSMTFHTLSKLAGKHGRFYKAIKNKSLIDQIPNSIEFLNNQKEK